jgi:hypothetical protein
VLSLGSEAELDARESNRSLSHYKDGDVGIGIFPEDEAILTGDAGFSSFTGEREF